METYWLLCFCIFFYLQDLPQQVYAQCNGSSRIYTSGTGEIRNPHYPNDEYNKSANCIWEFDPRSTEQRSDFALVFTIIQLRLFGGVGGPKRCFGSYSLTIGGERIPCDKYVKDGNERFSCLYSSSSCDSVKEVQKCKTTRQSSFPVSIEYFSDGRADASITANMFFRISYNIVPCLKGDTTPAASTSTQTSTPRTNIFVSTASSNPVSTTVPPTTSLPPHTTTLPSTPPPNPDAAASTSTRPPTMSQLVTTAKPTGISVELTSLVISSSHHSSYSTREILLHHVTETRSIKPSIADSGGATAVSQKMIIIIAAGGGGGLVLIVIVVAVSCICKRRRRQDANQEAPPKDDKSGKGLSVDQTYSSLANTTNEISGENTYNTLAETISIGHSASPDSNAVDLYDVLGGRNPTNQAAPKALKMTDISGKDTYNVLGEICPTNLSDSKVCDEMAQSGEGTYDVLRGAKLTGHSASRTYQAVELLRDETYDKLGGTKPTCYSAKEAYEGVDLRKQLTYDRLGGSIDATISSRTQGETHADAPSLPSTYDQSQSELYATVSKSSKIKGT